MFAFMQKDSERAANGPRPLIALSDYAAPTMPTEHAIRRLWRLTRLRLHIDSAEPVHTGDKLQLATQTLLDEVAAPPACGPIMEELQAAAQGWASDAGAGAGAAWLKVLVLPPCDPGDVVGTWALKDRHSVLTPPPRGALTQPDLLIDEPALAGQGLLVVPQLERWFLRHRDGLAVARSLIEALGRLQRPCIVGCNSWAWAFLEKAAGSALVLPSPITFEAFHAAQLREWFQALGQRDAVAASTVWHGALNPQSTDGGDASDETRPESRAEVQERALADVQSGDAPGEPLVFRFASTGADVLANPDDEGKGGSHASDIDRGYLKRLAARSLGIPWVAWSLWRDGLRAADDLQDNDAVPDKVRKNVQGDGRTLWVSELPEYSLPRHHEKPALMVLHALLMHGALTREQLRSVLPALEDYGVLSALRTAGYVRTNDADELHVCASAYPSTRSALKTAGFPAGVV